MSEHGLQDSIDVPEPREVQPAGRFRTDAMAAFVLVILLLTVGMAIGLRRIERVTADQLANVQHEEYEITLVQRLRWASEALASAGRGYLISTETGQLANLEVARRDFDHAVAALQALELTPRGMALLADVQRRAAHFDALQEEILRERSSADLAQVLGRVETELLPARTHLQNALVRLVGYKTAVVEEVYASAEEERARLIRWGYVLLGMLALGSLVIGSWSARRLARTYRREAEALETARKALAARDELMGIVAHDLRSPLGAITMRAEHVAETSHEPQTRAQAVAISNTASRMGHLIKTMLDVAVAEAGQLTVHPAPCDVDQLIREAVDMVSGVAASKEVRLEHEISDPGLVVMADRERIFQVLANLLENALKFTPKGGRVTVSAVRSRDVVTFAVSDTGPGIHPDHLSHIFERYWKDDSRTVKGTGLGLFIVKSIIDAHGGAISVASSPGHGATFRFTLRLVKERTNTASARG